MALVVEFTVEPFVEGSPGPHVQAALDAATSSGLDVEFGPFGTHLSGGRGGTRVASQISRPDV